MDRLGQDSVNFTNTMKNNSAASVLDSVCDSLAVVFYFMKQKRKYSIINVDMIVLSVLHCTLHIVRISPCSATSLTLGAMSQIMQAPHPLSLLLQLQQTMHCLYLFMPAE